MESSSIFLYEQFRQGDDQAARRLFDLYSARLISLARARISKKLGRRVDAEDVVQSAYRSFFLRAQESKFELKRSGDLWALLVGITLRKLYKQVERNTAAKRDFRREFTPSNESGGEIEFEEMAVEPQTSEVLGVIEELEQVMSGLDPLKQKILELRLHGQTLEQIAEQCDRSERTIRRILDQLRTALEQRLTVCSQQVEE